MSATGKAPSSETAIMPRRPNLDKPTTIHFTIPETEKAWLDLFLFSEAEGRVPYGAYNRFFADRIREFRERILSCTPQKT
jgi:hypothetical protein